MIRYLKAADIHKKEQQFKKMDLVMRSSQDRHPHMSVEIKKVYSLSDHDILLASFVAKARGIMSYDVSCISNGTCLQLHLDPYNPYDVHCMEIFITGRKLGHLCKEAACIISPFKHQGLLIKASVWSAPYSESVNRSWRYRVCDVLIQVFGGK